MKKLALLSIAVMAFVLIFAGCGGRSSAPDPDKIVTSRETLIANLTAAGYTIEELSSVEGSELIIDRVLAKKDGKFLDIVYGLSPEDAAEVFGRFCEIYPDNYYVLARNGSYVYCVSDRSAFKKAGFTSTDNVGTQYIRG